MTRMDLTRALIKLHWGSPSAQDEITMAITGRWPEQLGDAASRNYHLDFERIEAN